MREEILRMEHISKRYGNAVALDDFHLNLYKGEVIGIIGLSASGKTTIVEVASGRERVDSGAIYIDEELRRGKKAAEDRSVFSISRQSMLIGQLSVAENMFVVQGCNTPLIGKVLLNKPRIRMRCEEVLEHFSLDVSPDIHADELSVVEHRLVELVIAYLSGAKIILLDSVLEMLNPQEIAKVCRIVAQMCEEGLSFIFFGYRLQEMQKVADRIVLLKEGKNVRELYPDEFDQLLVNRILAGSPMPKPLHNRMREEAVLRMENVTSELYEGVSFDIRSGEIVGVFEPMRQFGIEMRELLTGMIRPDSGEILFKDRPSDLKKSFRVKNGMAYFSQNAINIQCFDQLNWRDNVAMRSLRNIGKYGFVNPRVMRYIENRFEPQLGLSKADRNNPLEELDIYTRQRIFLASWELVRLDLLIWSEPFDQVDLITQHHIEQFLDQKASQGTGIVILSSNPDMMFSVCDSFLYCSMGKGKIKYSNEEMRQIYRQV